MFIARLLINPIALDKLAARAITGEEVRELPANGAITLPNPRPRVRGSRLMIGETNGGRILTTVLYPTSDPAVWQIATGWEATPAQVARYRSES